MSKPSAIITKLEDCPDWLDRRLANAYWEADYLLQPILLPDEGTLRFRFDVSFSGLERLLKQADIQSFTIITAYNPGSIPLSPEENRQRHVQLQERLVPQCRFLRDSIGQSPDGVWQEPGFWALDIDLEIAVELGREFGQNAIVCWKRGARPELWWLE